MANTYENRCNRNTEHLRHDVIDGQGKGFTCPGLTPDDIDEAVRAWRGQRWMDHVQWSDSAALTVGRDGIEVSGNFLGHTGVRNPWALQVPYEVLHTGLRAIAAMATAAEDYETASYAYSILAGKPIPPDEDEEPDGGTSREDRAPRAYIDPAKDITILGSGISDDGLLILPERRCRECSRRVMDWETSDTFKESGLCHRCLYGEAPTWSAGEVPPGV